MTKKILITAGPVYGRIDDNKIISNRARGIWALRLGRWLAEEHGFEVYQVVADVLRDSRHLEGFFDFAKSGGSVKTLVHQGYFDYAEICRQYAEQVDAAVMAAAVLNYIPKVTHKGKLPTDKEEISLDFILAPKVINTMKERNPRLTLIGCKLLFSGHEKTLIDAAYKVVLDARCNMVIANDGKIGLKTKYLVHQDRTVFKLTDDYPSLYHHILQHIQDEHWHTAMHREDRTRNFKASNEFLGITEKYRHKFVRRQDNKDFVFGAVAVRYPYDERDEFLISPREKGEMFDNWDAGVCSFNFEGRQVQSWGKKVSLNAPLLGRHLQKYPEAVGVVHYHDPNGADVPPGLEGEVLPRAQYAPPGTVRDNERQIPGPCYWIDGHGWIVALDENLEPIR